MNIWLPFLCIYLEYDPLIIKNVLLSIIGFFHVSVWGSIPPMKLCMHIKGVGTIDYSTFFQLYTSNHIKLLQHALLFNDNWECIREHRQQTSILTRRFLLPWFPEAFRLCNHVIHAYMHLFKLVLCIIFIL